MILEDATWEAFGYEVFELSYGSRKLILAACELCGEFRVLERVSYSTFCNSCSTILGGKMKGENNHMFNKHHTKESKLLMHKNHIAQKGEKSPSWVCGRKISKAKDQAKRKQQLGYILLLPLMIGEVGHHVTDAYVIGISEEVHIKLSGGTRKKHRALVLEWLKKNDTVKYNLVLSIMANNSNPNY